MPRLVSGGFFMPWKPICYKPRYYATNVTKGPKPTASSWRTEPVQPSNVMTLQQEQEDIVPDNAHDNIDDNNHEQSFRFSPEFEYGRNRQALVHFPDAILCSLKRIIKGKPVAWVEVSAGRVHVMIVFARVVQSLSEERLFGPCQASIIVPWQRVQGQVVRARPRPRVKAVSDRVWSQSVAGLCTCSVALLLCGHQENFMRNKEKIGTGELSSFFGPWFWNRPRNSLVVRAHSCATPCMTLSFDCYH